MSEVPSTSSAVVVPKKIVHKAIGPKLRIVFNVVLALLAIIGANSAYLAGVTFLQWWTKRTYEDQFYAWMFLIHIVVGLLIVIPFIVFGLIHMRNTKDRKIRRTVMIGYALFAVCILVLVTGFLLTRVEGLIDLKSPIARNVIYWAHVTGPVVGGWLYFMHRLVGPKMRWKQGLVWAGLAGATAIGMVMMQANALPMLTVCARIEGV